jgi:hypothetical protein
MLSTLEEHFQLYTKSFRVVPDLSHETGKVPRAQINFDGLRVNQARPKSFAILGLFGGCKRKPQQ